jgi:membrane protein YqaA with SNARE-associated domain
LLRRLYDWAMGLAAGRHAPAALGAVSFAESSLFPIPPDVMLIPMVLANRKAWWRLALLCTITSVLGALVGYGIGALLFETVGRPIVEFYGAEGKFDRIVGWYGQWGGLGILAGAVTPLPYKVLTIFSGSVGFSLPLFIAVSLLGRSLRFFLVAGLIFWIGEPVREFIEKRLGVMSVLFIVLLVGGFVLLRFFVPG